MLLSSASVIAQDLTYEGVYRVYFEVSSFHPKGRHENWWYDGHAPCLDQYVKSDPELEHIPPVYLKVEGVLSPAGHYGHLNSYSRKLVVSKVIDCRVATAEESEF